MVFKIVHCKKLRLDFWLKGPFPEALIWYIGEFLKYWQTDFHTLIFI